MNALVLLPDLPYPARSALRLRMQQWLSVLRQVECHTHVVAMSRRHEADRYEASCRAMCDSLRLFIRPDLGLWRGLRGRRRIGSFLLGRYNRPALRRYVHHTIRHKAIDLVLCVGTPMCQYVPWRSPAGLVLDLDLPASAVYQSMSACGNRLCQWWRRTESDALQRVEDEQVARAALTVTARPSLARRLRMRFSHRQILDIPNGATVRDLPETDHYRHAPPHLTLAGDLHHRRVAEAALWLSEHVWPTVVEHEPYATLVLADDAPTALRRKLDQRIANIAWYNAASHSPARPGPGLITLAPWPDTQGVANSVVDAIGQGQLAITSPAVALDLPEPLVHHVVRADEPNDWATRITRLLRDRQRLGDMAALAHRTVVDRVTWAVLWNPVADLLRAAHRSGARRNHAA